MNFIPFAEQIIRSFAREHIRYALIGGFAVGLWGVARGTVDLDFLINRDDLGTVDQIMAGLGYRLHFRSENVSHFISESAPTERVDFLHAFRPHALAMLDRAVERTIFSGRLRAKTLIPEDLIGLKIQALANDPRREQWDLRDIETLLKLHGRQVDWSLIGEYCTLFDRTPLFEQLKERYS